MTRNEQIKQANPYKEATHETAMNLGCYYDQGDWFNYSMYTGFKEGAEWADANPNWHKYPDEKPTNKGRYLACDTKDNINVMWYNLDTGWYDYTPKIIIAWMELPQPPKFD